MEGARWDIKMGTIADAFLKELFPAMPVIYIKAVTQDKQDTKNVYECPVYKIRYVIRLIFQVYKITRLNARDLKFYIKIHMLVIQENTLWSRRQKLDTRY